MPIKVDHSKFHRRQARMMRARKEARAEALGVAMHQLGKRVAQTAPRDTNRYIRAAMMGFNQAGAGPLPVPAIDLSIGDLGGGFRARLVRQVRGAAQALETRERLLAFWYPKGPPRAPRTETYRRLVRDKRRFEKRLKRAQEELAKLDGSDGSAILIGGRKGKRGIGLTTVRTKVYGGRGRAYAIGPKAVIEIVIMEPHARFVEKRYRVFRGGQATLRSIGLRSASNRYLKKLQTAAGT